MLKNVDDKLKYRGHKNVLFIGSDMSHEMNRIQCKYNVWTYRTNNISLLVVTTKDIYLKMDTIGDHIFINELVNHTKIISSSIDNLL